MKNTLPPLPLVDGAFLIDNSGLELLKCPRLWELQFLRRRVLSANKAGRNFGSTLHIGWAVRYTKCRENLVTPFVTDLINDAMRAYLDENPQPAEDFRNYAHACNVMKSYNEVYQNEPFRVLERADGSPIVEASFALPFGTVHNTPVIYCGKIDLGIRNNDGLFSQDHKSAFMFGDTFDAQMQMDGGQLGYMWALKQTLPPDQAALVRGYIIDAVRIRRPTRKDEYTGVPPVGPEDFKRMPFFVQPEVLDEWYRDTLAKITTLFYHYDQSYFPMYRWNCTNKFGMCDMYNVCSLAPAHRENALASTQYEENTWTPLNKPV